MSRKSQKREHLFALAFLAPNFLCFFIFTLFPVVASLLLSFTKWDMLSPPKFIWLENYVKLFTEDDVFLQVLRNTLFFAFVTVPASMVFSLLTAVALNSEIKGRKLYRLFFFLPLISSNVIVAVLWKWLLVGDFGMVNYFLSIIGIKGPNWLTDERFALPAVCFVYVWKNLGFNMMIYLAGLQSIPSDLYDAVDIDGGGKLIKFFHITLPLLSSTTFLVVIMSIINSFQAFDLVKLMTNGGPARVTSVLPHYLYQNAFEYFKMGYASAISYVLFALVMTMTLIQFSVEKRRNKE